MVIGMGEGKEEGAAGRLTIVWALVRHEGDRGRTVVEVEVEKGEVVTV